MSARNSSWSLIINMPEINNTRYFGFFHKADMGSLGYFLTQIKTLIIAISQERLFIIPN